MTELRRWCCVLGSCLAVVAVGCGGDDDDASVPIEDVPAQLAEALCADILPCIGPLEDLFLNGFDCVEQYTATVTDEQLARWQAAIEAGTLVYHPDKAGDCIDAFAEMGCTFGSSRPPEVCEEALEGTVALDGECNAGVECAGVAYCKFEDQCPGTCAALEAEGASCEQDDNCQDGFACMGNHCMAPAAEGEACGGNDDPDCQLGLLCRGVDQQAGTSGTCQTFEDVLVGDEGDACDPIGGGLLCRDGLSCVLDTLDPPDITFVCAAGVGAGETCKPGFPDPCPEDQMCDADPFAGETEGTCISLPDEGEPCAISMMSASCAPGLACVEETCVTMSRIGEPCTTDGACYSGTCDGDTCAAPPLCEYDA